MQFNVNDRVRVIDRDEVESPWTGTVVKVSEPDIAFPTGSISVQQDATPGGPPVHGAHLFPADADWVEVI